MGVVEDKVIKNHFAAEYIYNQYKDTKTCGVIEEDKTFGLKKVADPIGVVAAIIPTTNPTSTTIFKILIALKTRNGIIISPHPRAKNSTIETAGLVGYTSELTEYVIENINKSTIAKEQKKNEKINVFTNHEFGIGETLNNNLTKIGAVDLDNPSIINIYPSSFDAKDEIEILIDNYNEDKQDDDKIEYTDYVGILMSSVTTIVDIISYVLIAFVSISLIVSSIMIGIITYISVLERTKEIGILRAIGASKKDIRRVFNAETFIIGLSSGLLGIFISGMLLIPINIILKAITGLENVAILDINASIILIIVSITLTLIGGAIPSRLASKKDPAVSLRTE
jgi:putative ABC transport system permease protein